MAIIKIVQKSYLTKESMHNLICYIERGADFCSGFGISMKDTESVISEFETIKFVWSKSEEGRRQVRHLVVSFSDREEQNVMDIIEKIAWEIAGYYGQSYQVFYGIHNNSMHLHIHFAINTVSFIDGKMLSEGHEDFNNLKERIELIVNSYTMNRPSL